MNTTTLPGADGSKWVTTSWGVFSVVRLFSPSGHLLCTTRVLLLMPWPGSRFSVQLQLVAFARGVA